MPIERAADHPPSRSGDSGSRVPTPARRSDETTFYRADLHRGRSPRHRHDHFDVFLVVAGRATSLSAMR